MQVLFLKIDLLKKNKDSLPTALKTLDDSIAKLKLQVTTKTNAVTEMEKVQRQSQAALDINKDRLTRSSLRLEGVQNTQEFQAINKEIDQLKKLNGNLEEQAKKILGEIEVIQKEISELNTNLETLIAQRTEKEVAVNGQSSKAEGEISTLSSERIKFTPGVDPKTLAVYNRVRGARGGLGIVPAIGGRCKGCNMMVPPQLFNEVQKFTQVHSCPSCHRLLFVPVGSGAHGTSGMSSAS